MSSLTPISTVLAAASTGWLSPDVLCDLLLYYSHYGFRLSATKPKPQPGALYLCDKTSMPDWFDDGLEWNLTGNGLLPIQNQPRLGFIQHQEERLSRRTSWLLDRENIILIHYLSTSKLQSNMTGIPATPALTLPMSAVLPTLTSPIITPPLPSNNIMHTPMMGTSPFTSLPMPTPPTSGSFGAGFPSPSIAPSHRLAVPASLSNSPAATPSQTPTHLHRHPSPFTDDSPRPLKRAHISSERTSPPTERIPMRRETDAIMQTIKSSTSANNASTMKSTGDDKTDRNRARKAEVARACRKRKKAYIKTLEDSVNRLMTRLTQAETELDTRRMEEPNLYTNESPRMISDLSDLLVDTEEQDESVEASEDIIPLIQRLDQLQKMRWVRGLHYMRHAIECLDPSPLVRVAVHGLDQKDDWYAPNAAFQTLFRKYAKVSPVKMQEIMSLRSATSPIRSAHDQLLTDLHNAYTTASHHLPLLQKHYDAFCTHLTPTQIARLHVTLHNRTHLIPPTVHSQQQQQQPQPQPQPQHHPPLPRPMSLPTRSTSNSSATSGLSVAVPHTPDTKVKLSPPSSPNKPPSTSSSASSTPTTRITTRSASGVLPKRGSGSSVGTSGGGGVVDAERSSQSGGSGATSTSTSSSASQSQSSPSSAPNSSPTTSSPPTPMAAAARVVPSLPIAALTLSSMSTTTFASPQASPFSSPSASPSMPMRLPLSPSLMNAPATAPSTTMTRAPFPLHTHAPALLKAQTLPTPKHTTLMSSSQFLTKHTFHPTAMASIVSPIATKYSNNTIISLHATMSPAMSPASSSQASSLSSTPASSAFQTPTQSRASSPSPSPSPSPPSLSRSMDSPPLSNMTSRESTPRMETSLSSSQIQYGDSSPTVSEYDMSDLHATEPATTSSCTTTSTCTSESTSESTERTEHLVSTLSTLAAAANEETLSV